MQNGSPTHARCNICQLQRCEATGRCRAWRFVLHEPNVAGNLGAKMLVDCTDREPGSRANIRKHSVGAEQGECDYSMELHIGRWSRCEIVRGFRGFRRC